jgi:hypothetical protein
VSDSASHAACPDLMVKVRSRIKVFERIGGRRHGIRWRMKQAGAYRAFSAVVCRPGMACHGAGGATAQPKAGVRHRGTIWWELKHVESRVPLCSAARDDAGVAQLGSW